MTKEQIKAKAEQEYPIVGPDFGVTDTVHGYLDSGKRQYTEGAESAVGEDLAKELANESFWNIQAGSPDDDDKVLVFEKDLNQELMNLCNKALAIGRQQAEKELTAIKNKFHIYTCSDCGTIYQSTGRCPQCFT